MTDRKKAGELLAQQAERKVIEGEGCRTVCLKKYDGEVFTTIYDVFPGIQLIYNDINTREVTLESDQCEPSSECFEINHCSEGRLECSFGDQFFYLSPGDLSIHRKNAIGNEYYFPTGHYHGISLIIDVEKAPLCLSCFLDDVNVRPEALMKKFCGGSPFVCRSDARLEHIFSELYSIPEEVKKGYAKIKVLEIMLFLSYLDVKGEDSRMYSAPQVRLAKEVCKHLTRHMEEKITIDDLSETFHVSPTQLKNCFKGVYGTSIYSFIRRTKMQSAADMLANTDKTVLEIANLHGYDNGSKFASAFSDVMGKTPNEYRKSILKK